MARTFKEILDEIENLLGLTDGDLFDSSNAQFLVSTKLRTNLIQDDIENTEFMKPYLTDYKRFATTALYNTGTVSITQNSKTVTGDGTNWTKIYKDQVFMVDDDISYRVKSVDSITQLTLDAPYIGSAVSGGTYSLYTDRYFLDRDTRGVMNMVDRENERAMNIITAFERSNPYIYPVDDDNGNGANTAIILLSKDSYYSTGTVAITTATPDLVGTSTDWTSEMIGMTIRLDGDSAEYEIIAVGSTTSITLDRNYEGSTATVDTYKIQPPGQHIVQLWPMPKEVDLYHYDRRYKLPRMVNDDDVSLVTRFSDSALVYGAIWQMKENEEVEGTDADKYKGLYEEAKSKMAQQTLKMDQEQQIKPYYM